MPRNARSWRLPLLMLAVLALIAAVALPAFAAGPSSAPGAQASEKPGKAPKASKEPEVAVTLTGTIAATADADGETTYALTSGGKTYKLDAGPAWFFGDKHPLKAFVGKSVTVTGEQSGDEVDVETVDGVALRAPGKPPWAGGWKAVGSAHPGWSQEKADRWAQKLADRAARQAAKGGNGANGAAGAAGGAGCWPPGHCKGDGAEPESSEVPRGD